ncbi:MAG: hypothetical protein J7513_02650 [Solirubrobacteraceae bacterium]|nr:hypothetical protein [Solirubrobacteraceae bacterium]
MPASPHRSAHAVAIAAGLIGALAGPSAAVADCAAPTGNLFTQVERAHVAFYGTAQPGELVGDKLASPATFAVAYRLDGVEDAPATEQVQTDRTATSMVSEGLAIAPKERWLITGTRGADGVVQTSLCQPGTRLADWEHRATWRIFGSARHAKATLSDTRGNPLDRATLPKLPRGLREIEVWTSSAARIVHRGKVVRLGKRANRNTWDFRRAVRCDRVVVATTQGFWAAEVR